MSRQSALSPFAFKSQSQAIAAQLVAERMQDVLVVSPTGSGKTVCYVAPCFVEPGLITVVLVPLVSLINDLHRRISHYGLTVQTYSRDTTISVRTRIILCAIEYIDQEELQNLLCMLFAENRLARIVVEECHVSITWTWRPSVSALPHVRRRPVPLILVSATVPPSMVPLLSSRFNTTFAEIREPSIRKNIKYTVMNLETATDTQFLMPKLQKCLSTLLLRLQSTCCLANDRVIVYFMSIQLAASALKTATSTITSIGLYHGELSDKEKAASMRSWVNGETKIMFATSAFGMGLDYPSVRAVVHFGLSYSLLDFVQASGRAGRDGLPAQSILLTSPDCIKNIQKYMATLGSTNAFEEMRLFLTEENCRQSLLSRLVDGVDYSCLLNPESEFCDVCELRTSTITSKRRNNDPDTEQVFKNTFECHD